MEFITSVKKTRNGKCNMNITVVVLHYENIKDTRECLDSLKKYLDDTKNNINIVVVNLLKNLYIHHNLLFISRHYFFH